MLTEIKQVYHYIYHWFASRSTGPWLVWNSFRCAFLIQCLEMLTLNDAILTMYVWMIWLWKTIWMTSEFAWIHQNWEETVDQCVILCENPSAYNSIILTSLQPCSSLRFRRSRHLTRANGWVRQILHRERKHTGTSLASEYQRCTYSVLGHVNKPSLNHPSTNRHV